MTIDEAIKHCEEEAEKYMEYGIETECYQCGKEHEQLAEWLTELKEAKRLLRLAVDDFRRVTQGCLGIQCDSCPHIATWKGCKWQYTDEAEKLLKDGDTNG